MEPISSNLKPICIHSYVLERKKKKLNIIDGEETEINVKETRNQRSFLAQLASKQRQIYDLNTKLQATQFELSLVNKKVYDLEYNNKNYSEKIYEWEVKYQRLKTQLNLKIKRIVEVDEYLINQYIKPCEWQIKYEEEEKEAIEWQRKYSQISSQLILVNSRVQQLEVLYKQSSHQVAEWQQKYQKIQIQHNRTIQNMNQQIKISVNQKVSEQKLEKDNQLQLIIQGLTNKLSDWQRKYSNQQITILVNQKVSEKNLIIRGLTNKVIEWQRKCSQISSQLILVNTRVQQLEVLYKQSQQQMTQWQQKYQKIQIQHNKTIENMNQRIAIQVKQKVSEKNLIMQDQLQLIIVGIEQKFSNQRITISVNQKVSEKNLIIQDLTNKVIECQRKYSEINSQLNLRVQELELLYKQSCQQLSQYQKIQIQHNKTIQNMNQQITISVNQKESEKNLIIQDLTNKVIECQRKYSEINSQLNLRVQELELLYKQSCQQLSQYQKIQIQHNKTIQNMNQQITISVNQKESEKNLIIQDLTNKVIECQRKYSEINSQLNLRVQELELLYKQSCQQLSQYQKIQIQHNKTIQNMNQQITISVNQKESEKNIIIQDLTNKVIECQRKYSSVSSRIQVLEFLYRQSSTQCILQQSNYKKIQLMLNQANQRYSQQITISLNQKETQYKVIISELTDKWTIQKQAYQESIVKLNNKIFELELQIKKLNSQLVSKQLGFNNINLELNNQNVEVMKIQKQNPQLSDNYSTGLQQYKLIQQSRRTSQQTVNITQKITEKLRTQTTQNQSVDIIRE